MVSRLSFSLFPSLSCSPSRPIAYALPFSPLAPSLFILFALFAHPGFNNESRLESGRASEKNGRRKKRRRNATSGITTFALQYNFPLRGLSAKSVIAFALVNARAGYFGSAGLRDDRPSMEPSADANSSGDA